ncbi:thermonuclease family protein [Devosia sp. 66-22]|uniref:thermonuclease family protein n=1 Tax=Devosia sp. 66-22 TaxID=1895753 RepID=UPI00344EECAC
MLAIAAVAIGVTVADSGGRKRPFPPPAERELGKQARSRMAQLLKTPGVTVYDSGEDDGRYQRPLVWVRLADGRSIGSILIAEGLAREWSPRYVADWC